MTCLIPHDLEQRVNASVARSTARQPSKWAHVPGAAAGPSPRHASAHLTYEAACMAAHRCSPPSSPRQPSPPPPSPSPPPHSRRACLPAPASCTACLLPGKGAHVRVVPARVRSCVLVPLSGTVLSRVFSRGSSQIQQWRFSSPRADSSPWISRCDASILCRVPSSDHPRHDVSPWLLMSHTLSGTVLSCPSKKLTPNQY